MPCLNRCGFHIVEFWNKYQHGPAVPEEGVVSVRTMDTSDDNNHEAIPDSTSLWYKISSDGQRMGFFYSLDGELWQMVRLYRNNYPEKVYLGISSQAPGEDACVSHFDKLSLSEGVVSSFRLGE